MCDVRGIRRWWRRQCRSRSRWVSTQFTGRSTKWSAVSSTEPVAGREMLNVIFVKMRCSVSRFMQGLSFDIWFTRTITCLKTSSWAFHHGNPDQRWLHRVERLGQHRHLHSPGVEGRGRDLSSWSWQVPSLWQSGVSGLCHSGLVSASSQPTAPTTPAKGSYPRCWYHPQQRLGRPGDIRTTRIFSSHRELYCRANLVLSGQGQ